MAPIWEAYNQLHNSRTSGLGGDGPIPISEIKAYCELMGISDLEERGELVYFIQQLDRAFSEHAVKKSKAQKGGKK